MGRVEERLTFLTSLSTVPIYPSTDVKLLFGPKLGKQPSEKWETFFDEIHKNFRFVLNIICCACIVVPCYVYHHPSILGYSSTAFLQRFPRMRLTTFTVGTLITTTTRLHHAGLKESNLLRPISLTALCASSEDPKSSRSEFVDKQQAMFDSLLPIAMLLGSLTFPEKSFAETKVVPSSSIKSPADISYPELRDAIQKGKVYVIENFIDSELLAGLREDVKVLVDTNQFSRSGLSNRAKGRYAV